MSRSFACSIFAILFETQETDRQTDYNQAIRVTGCITHVQLPVLFALYSAENNHEAAIVRKYNSSDPSPSMVSSFVHARNIFFTRVFTNAATQLGGTRRLEQKWSC